MATSMVLAAVCGAPCATMVAPWLTGADWLTAAPIDERSAAASGIIMSTWPLVADTTFEGSVWTANTLPLRVCKLSAGLPLACGMEPNTAFSPKVMMASCIGSPPTTRPIQVQLPSISSTWRSYRSLTWLPSGEGTVISPVATALKACASLMAVGYHV